MKKRAIGMLLVVAMMGITPVLLGCEYFGMAEPEATPTPTIVLPPVAAPDEVIADAVVVPIRSARPSLPIGGVVVEVEVEEGENVEAGRVLLQLDSARQEASIVEAEAQVQRAQSALADLEAGARPAEIESAEAEVAAAEAQLARVLEGPLPEEIAAAEATLAGARAALLKVREGPSDEELLANEAELANAQAAVDAAQAAYDRVRGEPDIQSRPESVRLHEATNALNAIKARRAVLQKGPSKADVAGAQAKIQEAQAQIDSLNAPPRPADIAAAEAEIWRAEAQLELLKAGTRPEAIAVAKAEVAAAQAALEKAKLALDETVLRAPMDGTVASLEVQVGEEVAPGSPAVLLADLSTWQFETDDLTELDIIRVHRGDPVKISFDAIPELELTGKVVRIEAIGENKMGDITYTVIISPDQHDDRLRWNMTATVMIGSD